MFCINVPAILPVFGSAAGKLGHAGIEARDMAQGKPTIRERGPDVRSFGAAVSMGLAA
jgi:hypothetical protein